jgi:hypothetical protein
MNWIKCGNVSSAIYGGGSEICQLSVSVKATYTLEEGVRFIFRCPKNHCHRSDMTIREVCKILDRKDVMELLK